MFGCVAVCCGVLSCLVLYWLVLSCLALYCIVLSCFMLCWWRVWLCGVVMCCVALCSGVLGCMPCRVAALRSFLVIIHVVIIVLVLARTSCLVL